MPVHQANVGGLPVTSAVVIIILDVSQSVIVKVGLAAHVSADLYFEGPPSAEGGEGTDRVDMYAARTAGRPTSAGLAGLRLLQLRICDFQKRETGARPDQPWASSDRACPAAVVRGLVEGWQDGHRRGVAEELLADDFVNHGASPGEAATKEQTIRSFECVWKALPDLRVRINRQVAEGGKVATLKTFSGTHEGELMGFPQRAGEWPLTCSMCSASVTARSWSTGRLPTWLA